MLSTSLNPFHSLLHIVIRYFCIAVFARSSEKTIRGKGTCRNCLVIRSDSDMIWWINRWFFSVHRMYSNEFTVDYRKDTKKYKFLWFPDICMHYMVQTFKTDTLNGSIILTYLLFFPHNLRFTALTFFAFQQM